MVFSDSPVNLATSTAFTYSTFRGIAGPFFMRQISLYAVQRRGRRLVTCPAFFPNPSCLLRKDTLLFHSYHIITFVSFHHLTTKRNETILSQREQIRKEEREEMSIDQLAKDPACAAQILADLEKKDAEATVCRYPTCQEPRQTASATGRPAVYCLNPEHNPVTNHRARQYLKDLAIGIPSEGAAKRETPLPAGVAPVESLRSSVVSRITQLQSDMERYLAALASMADPDLSAAQIRAALDQADARIAAAQQDVSVERSLHLAAETTRTAAQEEARAEREAAEQAIERMEEAEARIQSLMKATRQQIADLEAERNETVERLRVEAQQQREEAELRIVEREAEHTAIVERLHVKQEETEQQTRKAIAEAQENARQANIQAHEAHVQAATASGQVLDARAALDRERAEVDRLRGELAVTRKEARERTEADRAEARMTLDRERAEIERLRAELTTTRTRADQLAAQADGLRAQLVRAQITEKEKPNRA